ncbi:MATH domain [Orbilia oligospora]|uniref:MATH domain n=1 Tax=Orbilia oligospora TaxID=2813651 RepID=A0A7C8UPP0_ORBOL|nr:MATH domain [Orbilia oligospora]
MASTKGTSTPPAGDANGAVGPAPDLDADADGDQPVALVRMYHDPQFSDIKVFAGEDKECFDLHRVILAARSKYFELAFKKHFEEGKTRETYLPDIKPKTFTIVALWMYGGGFKYPDPFDKGLIQDVFIAADYLQILPLKNAIISAVEEKFWKMPNRNVGDAYDLLETFCAHSKFTDWKKFRLMVAIMIVLTLNSSSTCPIHAVSKWLF